MRFDSVADMPQGMRKKVVPKMLAKAVLQKMDEKPEAFVENSIEFHSEAQVQRFRYLLRAAEYGYISDLRIWEKVQLEPAYTDPVSFEKRKEVSVMIPFSYTRGEITYPMDWVSKEDYELWEQMSVMDGFGLRVFEPCGENLPRGFQGTFTRKIYFGGEPK